MSACVIECGNQGENVVTKIGPVWLVGVLERYIVGPNADGNRLDYGVSELSGVFPKV